MYSTALMRKAQIAKKDKRWERLRKEFQTCEYLNSGSYNEIPTKRGNLKEKVIK